ncbi:protein shisa-9-like, partial [Nothobranchius furzeri]
LPGALSAPDNIAPRIIRALKLLHHDKTLLSFRSFTIVQDAPRTYLPVCLSEWRTGAVPSDDPSQGASSNVYPVPRKRWRKRGKRAGIQVRIRLLLKHGLSSKHWRDLLASCPLFGDLSATSALPPSCVAARFLRPSFLRSVYPYSSVVSPPVPSISGFYKHHGSNPANLRPLTPAVCVVSDSSSSLSMALLNTRSVNNESFLLNDLILSKNLDFLFLTKVRQQTSDYSGLIELCPSDTGVRDYYKSYPMVDYTHRQSPPTFQPINFHPKDKPFLPPPDIHAPLAITINASQIPKPKISKTNTHPLTSSSAFKAWDPSKSHIQHPTATHMSIGGPPHHPIQQQQHQVLHQQNSRRQAYSNKRQFSIETLPELFSQPLGYSHSPHMHPKHKGLATNSKTEVTV